MNGTFFGNNTLVVSMALSPEERKIKKMKEASFSSFNDNSFNGYGGYNRHYSAPRNGMGHQGMGNMAPRRFPGHPKLDFKNFHAHSMNMSFPKKNFDIPLEQ